jgi:acetylornithine aminotransferase
LGIGNHGSTFGGNPLAMRAGLETIRVRERDGLLANAERGGAQLKAALTSGLAQELAAGTVKEIRGQGLMLGIELSKPCSPLMQQAADKGLLISVTADKVVRLVPSLVLTAAEAEQIAAILCPLITAFLAA